MVFCEWGGQFLLGKAREIADEVGDRVVAVCSAKDSALPQKLIYLGADEVVVCTVTSSSDWVSTLAKFLGSERGVKLMIFPSAQIPNALMGMLYGSMKEEIGPFMDDAEVLSSGDVAKKFENSVMIRKQFSSEKIALVSLKKNSVAEPFEDSSRFGKTQNFDSATSGKSLLPSEIRSSSGRLVILVGKGTNETISRLAERASEKFSGEVKSLSGKIEIVYGPCIAVEVASKLRELPEFRGEVISISSKRLPINSVAELSVVTPDVNGLLESLSA